MANVNAPFGFRPIKSMSGGQSLMVDYFRVASGTARIGKGDLVALQSSGNVARETSATAVGPWIGVSLIDTGGTIAAGGAIQIPVCCDPNAEYEVQGPTAALAQTDLFRIVQVNCGTAPDSNTGISKNVLTNTAATAANGVRLLRLANRPDNAFGAYQVLEVRLNATNAANAYAGV